MQEYLVEWAINLTDTTREGVVQQAVEILRDPNSIATVWHVTDEQDVMLDIDGPSVTTAEPSERDAVVAYLRRSNNAEVLALSDCILAGEHLTT